MIETLDGIDNPRQTFVEEGSVFHGTFESSCPIVVAGSIHGKITAPEVTVSPLGAIDGVIKVEKLTSRGSLSGRIDAVHVLVSGSVRTDTVIKAEQLDVRLYAERGRLEVTFGAKERDTTDRGAAALGTTLPGNAPLEDAPDDAPLDEAALDDAAPDDAAPDEAALDDSAPDEAADFSDGTAPTGKSEARRPRRTRKKPAR